MPLKDHFRLHLRRQTTTPLPSPSQAPTSSDGSRSPSHPLKSRLSRIWTTPAKTDKPKDPEPQLKYRGKIDKKHQAMLEGWQWDAPTGQAERGSGWRERRRRKDLESAMGGVGISPCTTRCDKKRSFDWRRSIGAG
jgi:hypothetical protein